MSANPSTYRPHRSGARGRTTIAVLAGVMVPGVCALAPPLLAQDLPAREATEVFRLGGLSAPEYAAWTRAPGIVAAPDGTILVRSSQPPSISVFDPEGTFVRRIGGEGEGPGEFRIASRHGLLADTLWVLDFPTPRLSHFGLDGTHIRTVRHDPVDFGRPLSAPGSVSALLEGPWALAVPHAFPVGSSGRVPLPVLHGSRDMTAPRALFDVIQPRGMSIEGLGVFALAPFPLPPLVGVASDGSGFIRVSWDDGAPGEMYLTRYAPDGSVDWERTVPYQPRRVTSQERERWIEAGMEMAGPHVEGARRRGEALDGSLRDLVAAGLYLPEHAPPARDVVLGRDGSIWLRTTAIPDERSVWAVHGPDGSPRFVVELPAGVRVQDATLDSAWGTLVGELDVPYVVRFDLR